MLVDAGRHRVGGGQTQSVGKGAVLAKDSGESDRGYPSQLGSTSAGSRDQSKRVGAPQLVRGSQRGPSGLPVRRLCFAEVQHRFGVVR